MSFWNLLQLRPTYALHTGNPGVAAWLDDMETGVPRSLFSLLAYDASVSLGLELMQSWEWGTVLPYGVDWAAKSESERLAAASSDWHFGRVQWDAMPWGSESGVWELRGSRGGDRSVVWLPWQRYTRDNLPPKPDWTQAWDAMRDAHVVYVADLQGHHRAAVQFARNDIANRPIALSDIEPVHVGDGIEHMPALIHALSSSDAAGQGFSPAVLRTLDKSDTSIIWTRARAHELLGRLTAQTNEAESAYNVIRLKYDALMVPLLDENGGLGENATPPQILDAREAAARAVLEYIQKDNLELEYAAAIEDLQSRPPDLANFRDTMIEDLESFATGAQKRLKGALSQQAIDNWAACVEVDDALVLISRECAKGVLAIAKAQDTIWQRTKGGGSIWTRYEGEPPDTVHHEGDGDPTVSDPMAQDMEFYRDTASGKIAAQAAFDAATAAIEAVTPLNVPQWFVDGAAITSLPATLTLDPGVTSAALIARHPNDRIEGDVAIHPVADLTVPRNEDGTEAEGFSLVWNAPSSEPEALAVFAKLAAAPAQKVTVHVNARNICGPAPLTIIFQPSS